MNSPYNIYEGFCYTCSEPRTILHWQLRGQYECMTCHSLECRLQIGYEMSVVLE